MNELRNLSARKRPHDRPSEVLSTRRSRTPGALPARLSGKPGSRRTPKRESSARNQSATTPSKPRLSASTTARPASHRCFGKPCRRSATTSGRERAAMPPSCTTRSFGKSNSTLTTRPPHERLTSICCHRRMASCPICAVDQHLSIRTTRSRFPNAVATFSESVDAFGRHVRRCDIRTARQEFNADRMGAAVSNSVGDGRNRIDELHAIAVTARWQLV